VFQKRFNGLVNFYRPFADYEEGFGTVHGEFWLGLKWLHEFTAYGSFELRVDIETANGTTFSDHYRSFRVTEGSNYKVYLDRWDWSPGVTSNSSLSNMNRMSFSTYDHQTHHVAGNNCDLQYEPGWWYYSCYNANLNGKYLVPGTHSIVGMCYENYDGNQHESLKSSKMMFRRN
ncbi:FCN1-like protein, partial [Mya arenaria]